ELLGLHSFPTRRSSDLAGLQSGTQRDPFHQSCAFPPAIRLIMRATRMMVPYTTGCQKPETPWRVSRFWTRPMTRTPVSAPRMVRSEEHTSELQSRENLV